MAKQQLFLVHGMGSYSKGWCLDAKQTLLDSFSAYAVPRAMGLAAQFDIVEINYNELFDDIRELWRENAEAAAGAMTAVGLADAAAKRLVDLANGATGDDFWRTHVLDVVMYRFLKQINERVMQSVRQQILDRLFAFPENDRPAWSILGHSLGTAVVNDTLHAMFTQPVNGVMLGDRFKPDFIFMVANVSKVLWNKGGDYYSSEVRPHTIDSLGMCWRYCNFAHELDPFPRVDPFDPPDRWFPPGTTPKQHAALLANGPEIPALDIQDVNVHGLTHYLSHPYVHAEIINTLTGMEAVSQREIAAARTAWRKDSLSGNPLKTVTDLLKSNTATPANWKKIIDMLFAVRAAVVDFSHLHDGEG